ncbi:MAG: phage major capsid protein [Alphaproteobacteria bacterium]|nr:phage major capsid protein [Alphaproteobacteria bacterium]
MSRLIELREKQARLISEARERLDEIKADTTEARAKELETAHDAAMAEHDRIGALIEREEKLAAAEKRIADARAARRPGAGDNHSADAGDETAKAPEYRDAFFAMLKAGGDLSELSPEMRALLRQGASEFRVQSTSNAAGGYTVPTTVAALVIKSMAAWGPMYDPGVCTEIVTGGGESIKLPTVNDTSVTAIANTEGSALTDSGAKDVTFGQKSLDAFSFDTEFVRWSWQLAQDSIINMEQLLADLLGERLGRIANSQLTTGTGSSAPNGIVTAASAGKISASATAITSDEVIDLQHSVDPAYRASPKCRFMFHDTTLQAIRKLKDGQNNYLWQMGDVRSGAPATLLGNPYLVNQAMDSIAANKKVIVFGDFGKYFVRKVGAPVIGVLRERFWPDLGIAGLIRFDGELGDTAAVKYLKTSNT